MTWHSLPVAVMAGISGYAAILFIGFHYALTTVARRDAHRENLTFALMCLAVMAYDITCVGLYNSHSLEAGIVWQRGNFACAALTGAAYLVFTWDFLHVRMQWITRGMVAIQLALSPVVLFWESPFALTPESADIKHVTVGHLIDVVYYEGKPGVVCDVLMVTFFVSYIYAVARLFNHFRTTRRRGIGGFLVAIVVSFVTATNDSLVAGGAYSFIYVFEYGIAMILMAMGYALFIRFGELHEEVEVLNAGLAERNADLVVALGQAQESARAKTEFLASISHELRTPLNAIINLPEGTIDEFVPLGRATCGACGAQFELEEGETAEASDRSGAPRACPACGVRGHMVATQVWHFSGDAEKSRHHLATVSRAGRHLLGLVNDILDASKLELGHMTLVREAFDLDALVADVVDSMRNLAEKGKVAIQIERASRPAPPLRLVADRVKLGQVLYNLLGNAIKFSPPRSTIDVILSRVDEASVRVEVRDRGIGIAKENLGVIFEKFRQVEAGATRAYGGTGLGLAISKSIVELHGGRIGVESVPGAGSTFFVVLPAGA